MIVPIDPRFLTAVNWTGQMTLALATYGSIPTLRGEQDWQHWARAVIALPAIAAINPPLPDHFSHWQDWALQFNLTAAALG